MNTDRPGAWDFAPVLELLHALSTPLRESDSASIGHRDESQSLGPTVTAKSLPSLGNFDNIFKHLGKQIDVEPFSSRLQTSDELPSLSESYSSSPSSIHTDTVEHFDDFIKSQTVKRDDPINDIDLGARLRDDVSTFVRVNWNDLDPLRLRHLLILEDKIEVVGADSPLLEYNNLYNVGKDRLTAGVATALNTTDIESQSDLVSDKPIFDKRIINGETNTQFPSNGENVQSRIRLPSAAQLTPTWVTPHPGQLPKGSVFSAHSSASQSLGDPWSLSTRFNSSTLHAIEINPILHLTLEEKVSRLLKKLVKRFGSELRSLIKFDIGRVINNNQVTKSGIHVFVDSSNIIIGFQNYLKKERGINVRAYTRRPPFSFRALVLIMERGRATERRVLVGSSRSHTRPDYMTEAIQCGYEVSSLEPVEKFKDRAKNGRGRIGGGYGTSGPSSGSETQYSGLKQVTEQGVDEILHMKMLESIVDTDNPSTMVLATGDAAEAEYSDGFLKNVERALIKGWNVELVAWTDSLSSAYRSKDFLNKWKGRFSIIALDDFSEECLALCVPVIPTSRTA